MATRIETEHAEMLRLLLQITDRENAHDYHSAIEMVGCLSGEAWMAEVRAILTKVQTP